MPANDLSIESLVRLPFRPYGQILGRYLKESNVFRIQRTLAAVLEKVNKLDSPFSLRRIDGYVIDWQIAFDIILKFIEWNLSRRQGNELLELASNIVQNSTRSIENRTLPKKIKTLTDACFKILEQQCPVQLWNSPILPYYFDAIFLRKLSVQDRKLWKSWNAPFIKIGNE